LRQNLFNSHNKAAHCCDGQAQVSATFGDGNMNDNDANEFTLQSTVMINHPSYLDASDGSGQNQDWCLIKFDDDILAQTTGDNVQVS
jgi:hypothetical protein